MKNLDQLKLLHRAKQLPKQSQIKGEGYGKQLEQLEKLAEAQFSNAAFQFEREKYLQTELSNMVGKSLVELSKAFSYYEQRGKELNKSLGVTSEKAAGVTQTLDELTTYLSVGGDKAQKYAGTLNKIATGFINADNLSTIFGKTLIQSQEIMQNNLKITEQAAQGFELYAAGFDKIGLDQLAMQNSIAEEIEAQTGMLGVQRDLTETIGNLAANLQTQYGRLPGTLELAVLKSRALGMSIADLDKSGQNLLNIESSIGQELEYQLLTGRRLIGDQKTAGKLAGKSLTNAYREATIRGDANQQANIMNQILKQEGDTLQNNLFARQEMAKLLGTDEASLARSIQQRKLLQQLGAEELMELGADDFQAGLKNLQKEIEGDPNREAIYAKLMKATDTRTSDERIADAVEKLEATMSLFRVDATGTVSAVDYTKQVTSTKEAMGTDFVEGIGTAISDVFAQDTDQWISKLGSYMLTGKVLVGFFKSLKDFVFSGGTAAKDLFLDSNSTGTGNIIYSTQKRELFRLDPADQIAVSPDIGKMIGKGGSSGYSKLDSNSINLLAYAIQQAISKAPINISAKVETPYQFDQPSKLNPYGRNV